MDKKLCVKRLITDDEAKDILKTLKENKANDLQALKLRKYPMENVQDAVKGSGNLYNFF